MANTEREERHRRLKEFKKLSNEIFNIEDYISTDYEEASNIDLISVSFNNPKIIEYQIKLIKKNLQGNYKYIVCDNSNKKDKAELIKEVCKKYDITYHRITITSPSGYSDSHGMALNRIYYDIIKKRQNDFALLDHDIFPIQPINIEDYLKDKNLNGKINVVRKIWYLWPGFTFMKYNFVKDLKINFRRHKVFNLFKYDGADTGSGNWYPIYSKYDQNNIPHLEDKFYDISEDKYVDLQYVLNYKNEIQSRFYEYLGENWFHSICGAEWTDVGGKNELVYNQLDKFLEN